MLGWGLALTGTESLDLILLCCDLQRKKMFSCEKFSSSGLRAALGRPALTSTRRSFLTFAARSVLGDDRLGSLLCSRHNSEPRSLSHDNNNLHLFKMCTTESLCTGTLDSHDILRVTFGWTVKTYPAKTRSDNQTSAGDCVRFQRCWCDNHSISRTRERG